MWYSIIKTMSKSYDNKFKNLVLYILNHEDYKEGGIKKLNKLLYFIDFYFYRDNEKLISGMEYAKAEMGPIIDGYKSIFGELTKDGVLAPPDSAGYVVYKPLESADLTQFSSQEIDHIGKVLDRYGKLSSSELESISHRQQPWLLTDNMGGTIDPDLALLMADDNSEDIQVENEDLKKELIELANSV
jgi:uncharacterized phage-associated protein